MIITWNACYNACAKYHVIRLYDQNNLVSRGPFCHALEIGTPGQVQQHSGFEWLCKHNRLRPEPIRFARLDSGHAQSDGKSVNHGLLVLYLARGRDPRLLNKRIAGSGNEIELLLNEFNDKHNIRQLNSVFPTESG